MFLEGIPKVALIFLIIGVSLALVGTVVSIIIHFIKYSKPKIKIDDEFIENLISLYGYKDNISKVTTDNGRLKVEVNDLDKVSLEKLKEISTNGVFVTGNTIKTLFRHDSDLIKKELEKRI